VSGPMTPNQTQPIETYDTLELELLPPQPTESEPVEVAPGRPNWEPEDGDFN
jgi:hypothetical protein